VKVGSDPFYDTIKVALAVLAQHKIGDTPYSLQLTASYIRKFNSANCKVGLKVNIARHEALTSNRSRQGHRHRFTQFLTMSSALEFKDLVYSLSFINPPDFPHHALPTPSPSLRFFLSSRSTGAKCLDAPQA